MTDERRERRGHDEERGGSSSGPVPVRDLMQPAATGPGAEGEPRWEGDERAFDLDGDEWLARPAGAGIYGTGGHGGARLLAVHFFPADEPETPAREALVPAGTFRGLRDEELRTLFQSATPIVTTEDQRRGSEG